MSGDYKNDETKMCPLFWCHTTGGTAECLKEQCGWWDYDAGQCSMVSIAHLNYK